ncbi:hypothetical protein RhiirC2_791729 [Rhizophagus irregularis]|uniref:Uncharacterized protein n=1 Tax=Rhizophagus irregularis TaxID=588596 RepID=A0A2N1MIM6_9GLOM|nr:hypothetical protein RhiirC2_791729 [Rhizophagus irregularis]
MYSKFKKSDVFLLREKNTKFLDKLADGRILVLTRTQYSDIFQIMETYQNLISNQQHYQILLVIIIFISIAKASLLALLCSLIILPENSGITTLTKDKSIMENFNFYNSIDFSLTSRQIFKLKSNNYNYIWLIIFEIVKILSLDVNILIIQDDDFIASILNQRLKDNTTIGN